MEVHTEYSPSKGLALTWYRARTWYSSSARPFAAPDDPQLVTRQQGSPLPACRQLSRARNVCAGGSREHGTKLKHGTNIGRTLCYLPTCSAPGLLRDHLFRGHYFKCSPY